MFGNPVSKLEIARMPTAWWLRPVSRQARLGEHRAVVWKPVNRPPPAARASVLGVSGVEPANVRPIPPSNASPAGVRMVIDAFPLGPRGPGDQTWPGAKAQPGDGR